MSIKHWNVVPKEKTAVTRKRLVTMCKCFLRYPVDIEYVVPSSIGTGEFDTVIKYTGRIDEFEVRDTDGFGWNLSFFLEGEDMMGVVYIPQYTSFSDAGLIEWTFSGPKCSFKINYAEKPKHGEIISTKKKPVNRGNK